uniref:ATP synthase F(0) complex subunit a n=1 Tax=Marmota marmota marmota TaxID=9994 RepID=A0A8C5Z7L1_MARMA
LMVVVTRKSKIKIIIKTITNMMAGHLLIHLIGGALLSNPATEIITFIILILLTVLEFAEALIQACVFTLLVNLYLHGNT